MDLITLIVVLVILGFSIYGGYFIVKIWRNTGEIEKYLKQKGDIKEFILQSKLKPVWDLYEKTFIDGKTTIPAEEFFAVANSEFTTGAKELSASTNTRIIDREKLSSMLGNISESYIIAMESRRMEKL